MKGLRNLLSIPATAIAVAVVSTQAQLNIPSDGSDGALVITNDTVIDLGKASYGTWDQNNSTNSGNGVYDPQKWAVVFKYSSVTIGSGATVTFLNHKSRAPVVWLVQATAVVDGRIDLAGKLRACTSDPDTSYLYPIEPGPGGFRGSADSVLGRGAGYGPFGGTSPYDGGAIYAVASGFWGSMTYGNPEILPLIGGSGGGGNSWTGLSYCGAVSGGAGAMLIAAGQSLTVNGRISAKNDQVYDYPGASGAIKLISDQILGSGSLDAAGTSHNGAYNNSGRVRVEANTMSTALQTFPNTIAVPPLKSPIIWPSDGAPLVRVASVNAQPAPADPVADVLTSSDLNISTNAPVDIVIQATHFPPSGAIQVRITPKYDQPSLVNASFVSGDFSSSTWKATTTLPNGFCVLQAHATSP